MEIIIDERENSLYEKCIELISSSTNSMNMSQIKKQVLALGDIVILQDTKPLLIIERKSFADLLASIKDGRYEEQSYRLMHSEEYPRNHVIYLLEGMFSTIRNPQEKKTILSAMSSLALFKGFHVVRTCAMMETAEYLLQMVDKLSREFKKGKILFSPLPSISKPMLSEQNLNKKVEETKEENPEKKYCQVVKKVKKENITRENIGEILLCQVPGISSQTAIAIMNHCNHSFLQFLEILKANPEILANISIGKKKISKKLIDSLSSMFL